jgi:hypothetical protein
MAMMSGRRETAVSSPANSIAGSGGSELAGLGKIWFRTLGYTIGPFGGVYTIGKTAVSADCCRIASVSQADLLERLPDKGQMGVDVMPGRYLNKLHLVRVSAGIRPAGSMGTTSSSVP